MNKEMKFDCIMCEQSFMNEETLNCHLLFEHGKWRGYCENPHSKTYFDEVQKLLRDLKRIKDNELRIVDMILIKRLEQLGYDFPIFLNADQKYDYLQGKHRCGTPYMGYSETSLQKKIDYEDKLELERQVMNRIISEVDNEI